MKSVTHAGLAGQSTFAAEFVVSSSADLSVTVGGVASTFTFANGVVTVPTLVANADVTITSSYVPAGSSGGATAANQASEIAAIQANTAQLTAMASDSTDNPIKGPPGAVVSQAPAVTAAAYVTGNVVGGKMTFAGLGRAGIFSGILQSALVQCKSAQSFACDLVIFNADPTNSTFTDKTALAVAAADFDKIADVISFASTDWVNLGTPSVARQRGLGSEFTSAAGTLYAVLVARGTPTFASTSDIKVVLKSLPD